MKKFSMKNLKHMKVKQRLIKSFTFVVVIASIAGILGAGLMLGLDARYSQALHLNGFIQGDLGNTVQMSAEVRHM